MRWLMPQPCNAARDSAFKTSRSRVPWRTSDASDIPALVEWSREYGPLLSNDQGSAGIRPRSPGPCAGVVAETRKATTRAALWPSRFVRLGRMDSNCLLYTSDAADERSSVDLGG